MVQKYLNRHDVRSQLGVDKSFGKYEVCSESVSEEFTKTGDLLFSMTSEVIFLLESGLRVLIYAGEYDWIW